MTAHPLTYQREEDDVNDNDIEELLRDEMRAEVAGVRLPHQVLDRAVRRYGRRRAVTRVAGVAAGAVVVAAGALAIAGPATHQGHGGVTGGGSTPRLETVADIRPKVVRALDSSHAIVHTVSDSVVPGGPPKHGPKPPLANGSTRAGDTRQVNDSWFDPDTGYFINHTYDNGASTPSAASHYPRTAAGTDTEVNYHARTWYAEPAGPNELPTITTGKLGEPLMDSVAGVRAAVQRGDIQVVGHDRINGRDAVHLRYAISRDGDAVTADGWFDSETYAPLKTSYRFTDDNGFSLTETSTFLPRTSANVAKAALAIPAGFQRVAAPTK